jgi:uncharacterized protein involved in exopolysaccharide biosynthesis
VLGVIAVFVIPARYTAQAYIRGEFFAAPDTVAKDKESTTAGSMNLDLVRVIETQSRLLLESHLLARRVVQQLGLERLRPLASKSRLLPAAFFGSAAKTPGDEVDVDIAATRLLPGLSVTSDPRAYLITVRYSAGDPELAELIANGFVVELLRSANLQTLFKQRFLAQATLSIQLAKFGDKHPSVAQARMRLAATDELLKEQLNEGQEAILQAAGENVTKATSFPSSRKFVIGLFLLSGLAIGVGIALWLERGRATIFLTKSASARRREFAPE